jgi:hypothetical protein
MRRHEKAGLYQAVYLRCGTFGVQRSQFWIQSREILAVGHKTHLNEFTNYNSEIFQIHIDSRSFKHESVSNFTGNQTRQFYKATSHQHIDRFFTNLIARRWKQKPDHAKNMIKLGRCRYITFSGSADLRSRQSLTGPKAQISVRLIYGAQR